MQALNSIFCFTLVFYFFTPIVLNAQDNQVCGTYYFSNGSGFSLLTLEPDSTFYYDRMNGRQANFYNDFSQANYMSGLWRANGDTIFLNTPPPKLGNIVGVEEVVDSSINKFICTVYDKDTSLVSPFIMDMKIYPSWKARELSPLIEDRSFDGFRLGSLNPEFLNNVDSLEIWVGGKYLHIPIKDKKTNRLTLYLDIDRFSVKRRLTLKDEPLLLSLDTLYWYLDETLTKKAADAFTRDF